MVDLIRTSEGPLFRSASEGRPASITNCGRELGDLLWMLGCQLTNYLPFPVDLGSQSRGRRGEHAKTLSSYKSSSSVSGCTGKFEFETRGGSARNTASRFRSFRSREANSQSNCYSDRLQFAHFSRIRSLVDSTTDRDLRPPAAT